GARSARSRTRAAHKARPSRVPGATTETSGWREGLPATRRETLLAKNSPGRERGEIVDSKVLPDAGAENLLTPKFFRTRARRTCRPQSSSGRGPGRNRRPQSSPGRERREIVDPKVLSDAGPGEIVD